MTAQLKYENDHVFSQTILREYDVRGIVGDNLNEIDAYTLGKAFGTTIIRKGGAHVCVAYDGRHSSVAMSQALIAGLTSTGVHVENMGLGPTPMLYFAVKDRGADGGIMITGSHNPAEYNGFKMTLLKTPFFGEEILKLGKLAENNDFEKGNGTVTTVDIQDHYVARLLKDLKNQRPLNIVWDNGNGAAGEILRRLVAKLPGTHTLLYDDIDGGFPNHHPDPTVDKNLIDLITKVKETGADLGIAFDGDGDRIGTVDEQGNILRCDALMTIYAKDVLSRNPGAPIIGDVKCSQMMFDEIARLGGQPIMWNTGHSLVKAKMAEVNAPLAGELSGHIFFADGYYGFDDALYCSIRLMNAVAETDAPFSSLSAHLPKLFNTPEVRIDVDEEQKFGYVPKIAENLKSHAGEHFEINDIDGVRIRTPRGWWLIRPSNTQNVLVTRVEADSETALAELKKMVEDEVAKVGLSFNFSDVE
ncbi:MAG: phosphomannomutase/phosphoglucomutase [Alphaproteobacteria bacterium]|nr:phosphomannomutase/phosphoglucomutase [Alphaproteobacteria bacterium]NCQ87533.1 phosphomannomutase/phosphoglucomutase [Alphaproteobacteria bacterium]NCT06401.1 phosphomannomutase/phosphoglucomutase [Alphaproteobacteria bacterium]